MTLSSLEFNYSAVSRRALGREGGGAPVGLTVWRDDKSVGPTQADILIEDVVVRYSDGPALMVSGDRITLR